MSRYSIGYFGSSIWYRVQNSWGFHRLRYLKLPAFGRIDKVYDDRNQVCSRIAIEAILQQKTNSKRLYGDDMTIPRIAP